MKRMNVNLIVSLIIFVICADAQTADVILTLKAADYFKSDLDSNEVYWYGIMYGGEPHSNSIKDFAVDIKGKIYIPQIEHNTLRIQVIDSSGVGIQTATIQLPDSIIFGHQSDYTEWSENLAIIVSANNDLFIRTNVAWWGSQGSKAVVIKVSKDMGVDTIWELGEIDKNFGPFYFVEADKVAIGKLIYTQSGELVGKNNLIEDIKPNEIICQAINGEIYRVQYSPSEEDTRFGGTMRITNKEGSSVDYLVPYYLMSKNPFRLDPTGKIELYKSKYNVADSSVLITKEVIILEKKSNDLR